VNTRAELQAKVFETFWKIVSGTCNAERERLEVKQGVKRARSIKEVEKVFFNADYWHMDLRVNEKACIVGRRYKQLSKQSLCNYTTNITR
jgi:hypothetical protein